MYGMNKIIGATEKMAQGYEQVGYDVPQSYVDQENVEKLRRYMANKYRNRLIKERAGVTAAGGIAGGATGMMLKRMKGWHSSAAPITLGIIGSIGANKIYSMGQNIIKSFMNGAE